MEFKNMTKIFDVNFRASDLILDRVLNPNHDPEIGNARPDDLVEACGIIPDFFCSLLTLINCLTIALRGGPRKAKHVKDCHLHSNRER